jgi:hypothetical protein
MVETSAEPTSELQPAINGTPSETTEDRLARIEAMLTILAQQQMAGPPPMGYTPPQSSPGTLVPLSQTVGVLGTLTGAAPPKRRRWLDWPVIREIRLVSRMYVDPRYSPSRTAQLGVPLILLCAVLNYLFWSAWLDWTFVSPVIERGVLMVFAVVLYRILANEIVRYAAVLDYLERSGR